MKICALTGCISFTAYSTSTTRIPYLHKLAENKHLRNKENKKNANYFRRTMMIMK